MLWRNPLTPQDDICSRAPSLRPPDSSHRTRWSHVFLLYRNSLTLSAFYIHPQSFELGNKFSAMLFRRLKFLIWSEPFLSYEVVSLHFTFQCQPSAPSEQLITPWHLRLDIWVTRQIIITNSQWSIQRLSR